MFVDAFSRWFSLGSFSKTWIRNWQSFAAEFGLSCTCCFLFFKLFLLWYISNRSLFAVMRGKYFYFDRRTKFVCRDVLKMFLFWSSIEVYLPWCDENIFTLIINRSIFAVIAETNFTLIINRSLVLQIYKPVRTGHYLNY